MNWIPKQKGGETNERKDRKLESIVCCRGCLENLLGVEAAPKVLIIEDVLAVADVDLLIQAVIVDDDCKTEG